MAITTPRSRNSLSVGPLEILPEERRACVGGEPLALSVTELTLLTELARQAGRTVSREDIFRLAWGREMRAGDRSVDVYVRKLRVKLEAALPGWSFIHTHFGRGYRLMAQPSAASGDAT